MGSNPMLSAEFVAGSLNISVRIVGALGEVTEWLKVHDWNSCVLERVPWVRIPPSPPKCCNVQNEL